jgi:glycosyltransferase involved in cell wall biosynthesis
MSNPNLKILYIDCMGPFGGASRSLYELVKELKKNNIDPYFLMTKGTSIDFYNKISIDSVVSKGYTKFDNTNFSRYKGLRWLIVLREIFYIPNSIFYVFKSKLRWNRFDIIHINEIHYIFIGILCKFLFNAKLVVHVRSVQDNNKKSFRTRFINFLLYKNANLIIAIDKTVESSLPDFTNIIVIHNSFTLKNYDSNILNNDKFTIGFVGNLHYSKGIIDLLNASILLKPKNYDIKFDIIGSYTSNKKGIIDYILKKLKFSQDVNGIIEKLVNENNLSNYFNLLGKSNEIENFYKNIDLICFPSHFDAPGRPIFEAALLGKPCVTCISSPKNDTFINFETGISVASRNPQELSKAIEYFILNRSEVVRMGNNAKNLANNFFNPVNNSIHMLKEYYKILNH